MQIDFFEEYPTPGNLAKARQLDFHSTVYIAARSLAEFEQAGKSLRRINNGASAGYWPILEKSYWISPFSFSDELEKLHKELSSRKDKHESKNKKLKVLLDLELPLDRMVMARNLLSFFGNRDSIGRIFNEAGGSGLDIHTAEYHATSWIDQKMLELLGVSYPIKGHPHKKITMFYSSLMDERLREKVKAHVASMAEKFGNKFQVGLGTIATGVFGNEAVLSPKNLEKDLNFIDKQGIGTAVVFRLGGLNKEYLRIIKQHI